jgi:uncharacterized membrane protein
MINIIPNWHPVFVHFTVALLIVAAAIHLLSHFISSRELATSSGYKRATVKASVGYP